MNSRWCLEKNCSIRCIAVEKPKSRSFRVYVLKVQGNPAGFQRLWLCITTLILFPDSNIFEQNNVTNGKAAPQGASRMISSIHQFTDRHLRNGIQSSWVVNPIFDDQNQRLCGICIQLQDVELNPSGSIKRRLKTILYISR